MTPKVIDIFNGSRALLNDQENATFTDSVLMPYLMMSYDEFRQQCEDYNIPITNKTSAAITIPIGTTDIGGPTGPPLPSDLVDVLECWEIPAGTNDDYMLMKRVQFLPKTAVLTAYLEVYQWANQQINFLGANGAIQVKIDYVADTFGLIVDDNTLIQTFNCLNYLKAKTAGFAAMFAGENETRAGVCNDLATQYLDLFLGISIKSQQNISTRRRPFMAAYKHRGATYGR